MAKVCLFVLLAVNFADLKEVLNSYSQEHLPIPPSQLVDGKVGCPMCQLPVKPSNTIH